MSKLTELKTERWLLNILGSVCWVEGFAQSSSTGSHGSYSLKSFYSSRGAPLPTRPKNTACKQQLCGEAFFWHWVTEASLKEQNQMDELLKVLSELDTCQRDFILESVQTLEISGRLQEECGPLKGICQNSQLMSYHPHRCDKLYSKENISRTTVLVPCFPVQYYSCLDCNMHLSSKSREKGQTPNNTSHMLSSLEIHQKVTYTDICHKRDNEYVFLPKSMPAVFARRWDTSQESKYNVTYKQAKITCVSMKQSTFGG